VAIKVINVDTPTLGDRSYIAHDGKSAVVVDPQRDIDRVEKILVEQGLNLDTVIETHMHNDYVSGGLVLAKKHSAKYLVSELDPVNFERFSVVDNQVIPVGTFAVKALHTPGHTFTHLSYELLDEKENAQAVFTGGSILHGSTGRPDLLGWEHARELAGLQHSSAHRLANLLEDRVNIYPTHGFGSFCAATSTSGDSSTIGDEKKSNPALLLDQETFIVQTLAGLDVFPGYYKHMGPANLQGAGPIDLSELKRMSTSEIMNSISNGAWVVDVRNRNEWATGHIPGSVSFGVDGSMATYLGWMFPYEKELILVSDKAEEVASAQRELVRIGIDRPSGSYVENFGKFKTLNQTQMVTFEDVAKVIGNPGIVILDVRRNSERQASYIEKSLHIPLHELTTRVNELPQDAEIWVHCAGAYRAAAAMGIIEKTGRIPVLINEPYEACLTVAGLNIVFGQKDNSPSEVSAK
jgi:glyoxylase-like metal-dependent hydrolase (beta-lactamase superfamily II)/rhodanese-related sulfurtransferase